jgi:hypothetical protein
MNSIKISNDFQRSRTKSAEKNKEKKDKDLNKIIFSLTQNTTVEDDDNVYKSYKAISRPKTANPSFVEDPNLYIKNLTSPKICKTPQIEAAKTPITYKIEGHDDKKFVYSNPLKFLHDFMNKSKINHSSSSNHLKMPKKSTFIESKGIS